MYDVSIVRENREPSPVLASFASQSLNTNNTPLISGGMQRMNREGMTMCMPSCMSC
jgi:hypothetical protein